MHCPACKTHNSDTNRYCENCGGALGPVCAHCGRENGRNAKFCGHCGSGLAVLSTLPTSDSANSPAGGAGISRGGDPRQELKIATVLFADIANSTEEVAQLGAEEAMQRLQPVVRQMCTPVERYGGTVVRTLGDGIMALFGAPMALEGHVRLACEAALRIQGIFENEDWKLGVRVGLHTGQVASDPTVGLSARSDGVHGLTIHLANRVMASAEPGEIRITQATQELAADSYEFRAVGLTALRGIAVPQALFTLLGARRAQDLQLRRNTRAKFHGRIEEMKQLQASLALAQEGRARVIGISGEPGAGKSRLCAEFASWCRERGATVHEIRSQLYGHAAPLQPVLELFRQAFFGIGDADDPETVRSKIARCLAQCDQDHAFTVDPGDEALLAEFIGLATAEDTSQAVTATFRRGRLLALARQLVRLPREGVSLILLEDLHWLDEPSLEFLSELVASVEGTRVLLLLNYRPNFSAEWQGNPNYEHIRLEGLANEVVEQIVQDLTNYQLDLSDVRELIIRRSGGNPLFAEELVRALNEDLISVGAPKPQYRIEILERSLPFSVQSIIGARIDRLDPSDKSLLQMCSVVGKDIPRLVLEHIAAEEVHGDITKALGRLCAADFIQRNADEDRFEYSFRHPLIQEVAYETQLRARRSAMHEVVATVMEKHYAGRGKEFSALIAHHFEAAGSFVKAATHESRAAKWIAPTNASQAIRHWRRVRELLKDQAPSQEVDSLRSLAGGRILYLGWREGLSQLEVQQIMDESLALAEQSDIHLVQLLLFAHGRSLQSSGGASDEYIRSVRRALELDASAPKPGRAALLNIALSQACAWSGLLREGMAANDAALAGLADIDDFDREFIGFDVDQWAHGIRVRLLNRLGRFDDTLQYLARISERASARVDPVMKQIAHHVYIDLAWCSGRKGFVAEHAEHVLQIAEASRSSYTRIFAYSSCGIAALVLGDHAQARSAFNEALTHLRQSRAAIEFEPEVLAGLAECSLALGLLDEATNQAELAINAATHQSNRIAECRSLIALANALAQRGQPARTPRLLQRAEDLIDITGACVLRPRLDAARENCLRTLGADAAPRSAAGAHQ